MVAQSAMWLMINNRFHAKIAVHRYLVGKRRHRLDRNTTDKIASEFILATPPSLESS
jgi:hypothetical protein